MYSIREERFVCPYCGDTGPTLSGTNAHVTICKHNPINHMCASCAYVGQISSDEELAGADIECLCRHKSGVDDIHCLYVTNTCKHHASRDRQGQTAYREYKVTYICPHCSLHMRDMTDMRKHIDTCIHNPCSRKKLFVCEFCGLEGSELDINCHMQICQHHPGNKRCRTCRYFELDSFREAICLGPTDAQHMPGLHTRCSAWQKHAEVVWPKSGMPHKAE